MVKSYVASHNTHDVEKTLTFYDEDIEFKLKGKLLMPIHWGAFKLALHSWTEPVERLLKAAREMNVKISTPKIGEPFILGESAPLSNWWGNKNTAN